MDVEQFVSLPVQDIAQYMQSAGPKVCVFPINGTRRWFLLEHPPETWEGKDFLTAYHQCSVQRQLQLYRLFFEHGIDTLLMPLFGPDLLDRGPEYVQVMAAALQELAAGPVFLDFYRQYGVRVHFYGDHRKYLGNTPYAGLSDVFDTINRETAGHNRFHLYYGVFAHDATETVAELGVGYFQKYGSLPDKRQLVTMYYGEYVPPVSLFIGFDRFSAFDMPLIATGSEDLYFTVSPSFYMTEGQLRRILYDHLFARRVAEQDYEQLSTAAVKRMADFYRLNGERTLGLGEIRDGFWYPTTNVIIPPDFLGNG